MTRRTDYYDDVSAPPANSLVPAASAVVLDDHGCILLQRRRDNDLWALPGGVMKVGETIAEAAVREVKEETNLDVAITGLIGIYSDPKHVIAYSDGEVRQEFNICFSARASDGSVAQSRESHEVRFVSPEELDQLPMHPSTRLRIDHRLQLRSSPFLG